MKLSTSILFAVPLLTVAFFCHPQLALAQVETIDPNPTLPADVTRELTYRSGISDGGYRLGRAIGSRAADPNPAETLLRSIDGSNYGHYSGHSIFSRSASRRVAVPRRNYQARNAKPGFRAWPNATRNSRNAMEEIWPRGHNGSGVGASPEPGGAPYQPNTNLPSPVRWPRGGSGVDASPEPGGALPRNAAPPPQGQWPQGNNGSSPSASPDPGGAKLVDGP